jgi:hypothetical protein
VGDTGREAVGEAAGDDPDDREGEEVRDIAACSKCRLSSKSRWQSARSDKGGRRLVSRFSASTVVAIVVMVLVVVVMAAAVLEFLSTGADVAIAVKTADDVAN